MIPKISNIEKRHNKMSFKIDNIDKSIINGIRRTMISDIPIVGLITKTHEKNTAVFHTNTTKFNNEVLKNRLSGIPIHVPNFTNFPFSNYEVVINEQNTSNVSMMVTTEHFKIRDKMTDKYLSREETKKIFPPFTPDFDPQSEYYVDFVQLLPKLTENITGGHIHVTCPFSIAKPSDDYSFNSVTTISYKNVIDEALQKKHYADRVEELKAEFKLTFERDANANKKDGEEPEIYNPQNAADKAKIEKEMKFWPLLQGKRSIYPNNYEMTINSVGVLTPVTILRKACNILLYKCNMYLSAIDSGILHVYQSTTKIAKHSYNITLQNEGHTFGPILNYLLYDLYFDGDSKELDFIGFIKLHPHDKDSLITLTLTKPAQTFENNIAIIHEMLKSAINSGIAIITSILTQIPSDGGDTIQDVMMVEPITQVAKLSVLTLANTAAANSMHDMTKRVAHDIAIIVPFRDMYKEQNRAAQLEIFLSQMPKMFKSELPTVNVDFYIIDQDDTIYKFNRGKLLNIGFKEASKKKKYDVYVLHDVDLIPSPDLVKDYALIPTDGPIHIANVWDRYSENPKYLGGITSFTPKMFETINGFSNSKGTGWGGEDDILYNRAIKHGYRIEKINRTETKTIRDLENTNLKDKLVLLKNNPEWLNEKKREGIKADEINNATEGLNSLKYTVNKIVEQEPNIYTLYVDIGLNDDPAFDQYAFINPEDAKKYVQEHDELNEKLKYNEFDEKIKSRIANERERAPASASEPLIDVDNYDRA